MSCIVCGKPPRYRCNATRHCNTVYCSQQCGDLHVEKHICSPFIGATWADLPRDLIVNQLMRMPMNQLWRLCATERRISEVCRDRNFRLNYLRGRGAKEVQSYVDYMIKKENASHEYVLNEWFEEVLNSGLYDPSANNSSALGSAIWNNYTEIAKLLLQDPRVDPNTNGPLSLAAIKGNTELVKILLRHPNVDVATSRALIYAIENNHIDIAKLLLADPRVNLGKGVYYWKHIKFSLPHIEMVKLLLEDGRFDFGMFGNEAIALASQRGYIETVKLLLQVPGVDPSDRNNIALVSARQTDQKEIIDLLLKDERVIAKL